MEFLRNFFLGTADYGFVRFRFMLFAAIVVAVYYLLPHKLRNLFLLLSSYYFLMRFSPVFAVYVIAFSLVSYGFAFAIAKAQTKTLRHLLLAVVVLAELGCLIVFKYASFFSKGVDAIAGLFGGAFTLPAYISNLVEPLGISYYTFSTLGYLIDVSRRDVEPEKNPIDYSLFVSFFPHLIMGPIPRAKLLLPQMKDKHTLSYAVLLAGGQRFFWGLFKKVVAASWLNLLVDHTSAIPDIGGYYLFAAFGFMLYLYFDFSAYCDMALGIARMLGFTLAENFDAPFFSTSITEYWSRWHMSLTSWLRDYIYIPLGGNRKGFARKLINIMLVFLISGLWHRPSLSFLVWGGLFGVLRIVEEVLHHLRQPRKMHSRALRSAVDWSKRLVTFALVSFCFVFFRVTAFSSAIYNFKNMINVSRGLQLPRQLITVAIGYTGSGYRFSLLCLAVAAISIIIVLVAEWIYVYNAPAGKLNKGNVLAEMPTGIRWACYIFMALAIVVVGNFGSSSFVYQAF